MEPEAAAEAAKRAVEAAEQEQRLPQALPREGVRSTRSEPNQASHPAPGTRRWHPAARPWRFRPPATKGWPRPGGRAALREGWRSPERPPAPVGTRSRRRREHLFAEARCLSQSSGQAISTAQRTKRGRAVVVRSHTGGRHGQLSRSSLLFRLLHALAIGRRRSPEAATCVRLAQATWSQACSVRTGLSESARQSWPAARTRRAAALRHTAQQWRI